MSVIRTDSSRLIDLETEIETGLTSIYRTWHKVGLALREINDLRLYRPVDTFGEYVEERWHIKRATAYEWMIASDVARDLESSNVMPPRRLNTALVLAKLHPAERAQALTYARTVAKRGEPTSKELETIVDNGIPICHSAVSSEPESDKLSDQDEVMIGHCMRLATSSMTSAGRRELIDRLIALSGEHS